MKLLKGIKNGVTGGGNNSTTSTNNHKHDKKKKKSSKKTSSSSSKASRDAIDDHVDTEITYWAGESFSSIASSVTSPPSMTASFYAKALQGWDLDDDDDNNEDNKSNDDDVDVNGDSDDNDDHTTSTNNDIGDSNRYAHSDDGRGGASVDSRSLDADTADTADALDSSSRGSKGSRGKKKKTKKEKKFRLRGKKKHILSSSKDGPKQETVIEESSIYGSEDGTIDGSRDGGDGPTKGNDLNGTNHTAPVIYGYGYDYEPHNTAVSDDDDLDDDDDAAKPPKAFRKTRRRASMGDVVSQEQAQQQDQEQKMHKYSKSKRRNSLLGGAPAGPSSSPTRSGSSPKPHRRQRRHSMFGSAHKTDDDYNNNNSPKQERAPQKKPQRRRRSLFGSTTDGGESVAGGSSSTASTKIPKDIHKIVNQERIARGMEAFRRNMLLDTLAQSLANDMATGRQSGGCDYHGNVGQGMTLQIIHNTLMENRSGPARKNILSTKFEEFGMAVVQGPDGILHMCQLFS